MTKTAEPAQKVQPLQDALKIIAIPEIAVKLAIGAKVSDCPEGKLVSFEGDGVVVHEDDIAFARKIADRVASKLGRKMSPGRLVTACTYASQFVAEELLRPDVLRVMFYTTLSKASAFYRCLTPAYTLNSSSRVKASVSTGKYGREILEYDVISIQIDNAPSTIGMVEKLKEMGKKVVYEVDDAFDVLETWHPQYAAWGREKVDQSIRMMQLADLVTTSTPWLAEHFRKYNPNIQVIPNLLDLSVWPQAVRAENRSTFRIVWAGAKSHKGDLDLVASALEKFAKICPSARIVFFGQMPDGFDVPESQVEYHEAVDFEDYPEKLASLDADVAIAPLSECEFNRGKSNLRIIQYMACGWPVIASDIEPYSRTMRSESGTVGGLLVPSQMSEWVNALDFMMKCPGVRKVLAKDAPVVSRRHDLRPFVPKIEKIFLDLVAG
jgi:glycosyltransferase involved in cell wall biosynthesis